MIKMTNKLLKDLRNSLRRSKKEIMRSPPVRKLNPKKTRNPKRVRATRRRTRRKPQRNQMTKEKKRRKVYP